MSKALNVLDSIVWGLLKVQGLTEATITIELPRKSAEEMIFKIDHELEELLVKFDRRLPILSLGAVFKYRGIDFRIVERTR